MCRAAQPTILLIAVFTLAACMAEPGIEGTWVSEDGRPVVLTFGGGKAKIEISAFGQDVALEGDYTRDQNRLAIKHLSLPPELEKLRGMAGKSAQQRLPDQIDATISFKTESEIVLSGHKLIDGVYKRKGQ